MPFASQGGPRCIGVDVAPHVGSVARKLFANLVAPGYLQFLRARAEALPFESASFDVVICRLALPYTHNATALAEIARVIRPDGFVVLRIHHALYYVDKLLQGVRTMDINELKYAGRVLVGGTWYLMTGHQPQHRLIGREVFQTAGSLMRDLAGVGLTIQRKLPESTSKAPSFLIAKQRP